METLQDICQTLELMRENEEALLSLSEEMKFEKEALQRAQESLVAHLDFLKDEYQKTKKLFSKMKFVEIKQTIFEKVLSYNRIAHRPLTGYLDLFRESNVRIRRRRVNKVLVTQ